jgi:subtilisin family serine protease
MGPQRARHRHRTPAVVTAAAVLLWLTGPSSWAGSAGAAPASSHGWASASTFEAGLVEEAQASGGVDVVIRLRTTTATSSVGVERAAAALVDEVGEDAAATVDVLPTLGVVSLRATPGDLRELSGSALVDRVEQDAWLAPALDHSTAQIGAPQAWSSGYTGAGQAVAVIDSGVESSHPALAGRVVHEACFSNGGCPNGQASMTGPGAARPCGWGEGCDHGTHVAGVIAARGVQRGVAPDASLVAVQVFSASSGESCGGLTSCPRARTSDVLAALEHINGLVTAGTLGMPLVAVNLSLASDVTSTGCDDSILATGVNTLWKNNVATIVAAGNSGRQGELSIPACISSTISVGAVDGSDAYWPVSNVAAGLDYLAPGVGVTSTWPGGAWRAASGTSTAAPHVAGAWAVAAQAMGANPKVVDDWFSRHGPALAAGGFNVARIDLAGLHGFSGFSGAQWSTPQDLTALAGDFDGDGYDDIYWFDRTGAASQIWWYGPGGRQGSAPSPMGGAWRPATGDFNGDGRADILWYDPSGPTSFWFGRSGRSFEASGPLYPYGNFFPFTGDFNGDGFDDVYLYGRHGGPSHLFWMGADPAAPGFATVTSVGTPEAPGPQVQPAAGDFDGDGAEDIYWLDTAAGTIEWSQGDGSFQRSSAIGGDFSIAAADLDGTGPDDLVFCAPDEVRLWWGGLGRGDSLPVHQRADRLPLGAAAVPVAGRFFDTARDALYFYGPTTPADTYHRPVL